MRELEGVREQVEDDLLPHVPIDRDAWPFRRNIDDEAHPDAFDRGAECAGKVRGEDAEVELLERGLGAACLDAREVEQRVDDLEEPERIPVHHREVTMNIGRHRAGGSREEVLERTEHERERRPELVAHVAEKGGLGAVERDERLGSLSF